MSDSSMASCKVEEVKVGVESGSNMASLVEEENDSNMVSLVGEVKVGEENDSNMAS